MQENNDIPRLILASASPRRQELLGSLGLSFAIEAADIDENCDLSEPGAIVSYLSLAKAQKVAAAISARALSGRTLILAADTIVVLDKLVLGKPQSEKEAFEMLMLLSGRKHKVFTGVSLLELPGSRSRSIFEESDIYFRKLGEAEVACYAASDEPRDKAGAYALQGVAGAFVERVEGCCSNVIGLPLSATVLLLREFGLSVLGCPRLEKREQGSAPAKE